jgi:hypothetical protein
VNGDGGNVQLAAPRSLIQRLNVFQPMLEPIPAQIDLILCHRIKHECVIRIRGVTQRKDFGVPLFHVFHSGSVNKRQ